MESQFTPTHSQVSSDQYFVPYEEYFSTDVLMYDRSCLVTLDWMDRSSPLDSVSFHSTGIGLASLRVYGWVLYARVDLFSSEKVQYYNITGGQ